MIRCIECEADLKIPSDAIEGEIITCPDCGASYELVKQREGFNIKPAQVVGEDWGE
jgi:alpha-aminoadipate carrier protein LysW